MSLTYWQTGITNKLSSELQGTDAVATFDAIAHLPNTLPSNCKD